MHNSYRVEVFPLESSSAFFEKGFLKCTVTQTSPPYSEREFCYCLHFRKLRSVPWFYAHQRLVGFEPSPDKQSIFRDKYYFFSQDIFTEVDFLNDPGKLFPPIPDPIQRLPGLDALFHQPHFTLNTEPELLSEGDVFEQNAEDQIFPCGDPVGEESSIALERLAECISNCFDEFCFENKTMDLEQFASLVQTLFGEEDETGCLFAKTRQSVKAKILSRLTRKVFVMLTLTRSQMDTLNRFMKAVLIFMNPENCTFARKIHAGYFSCIRESIR